MRSSMSLAYYSAGAWNLVRSVFIFVITMIISYLVPMTLTFLRDLKEEKNLSFSFKLFSSLQRVYAYRTVGEF